MFLLLLPMKQSTNVVTIFLIAGIPIAIGLLADGNAAYDAALSWDNSVRTYSPVVMTAAAAAVTAEQREYCLHLVDKKNALETTCAPGCTYQVSVTSGKPSIDVMAGPNPVPKKTQTGTQSTYDIKWSSNCPTGRSDCPLPPGKVFYVVGMIGLSPGGSSDPSTYGPIMCDKSKNSIPPSIGSAINQSQYGSSIGAQLSGYSGSSQSPTGSLGTVKTAPQNLAQTISNSQSGYSWNNLPTQQGTYNYYDATGKPTELLLEYTPNKGYEMWSPANFNEAMGNVSTQPAANTNSYNAAYQAAQMEVYAAGAIQPPGSAAAPAPTNPSGSPTPISTPAVNSTELSIERARELLNFARDNDLPVYVGRSNGFDVTSGLGAANLVKTPYNSQQCIEPLDDYWLNWYGQRARVTISNC